MGTINERFREVREATDGKLSQEAFAERIGLTRSELKNIEYGKTTPKNFTILQVCEKFNINEDWLRYGEGPKRAKLSRDQEIEEMVNSALRGSNEFKKAVIRMICSRTDEELKQLDEMLRAIYDNIQKPIALHPDGQKNIAAARSGDRMEAAQVSAEEEDAVLPPPYTGDI